MITDSLAFAELMRSRRSIDVEVIVVDDGSTDASVAELLRFGDRIKIVQHHQNQGYGAAIKSGARVAKGELIGIFDLDSTCAPWDLELMLNELERSGAEMIVGNRRTGNSKMPLQRFIGNFVFSNLTMIMFRAAAHDVCSGYRLVRREALSRYSEALNDDLSFCLGLSLRMIADRSNVRSVDISYGERLGSSKLSVFKEGPVFLGRILGQWLVQLGAK